jgi:hypothetical protein
MLIINGLGLSRRVIKWRLNQFYKGRGKELNILIISYRGRKTIARS